MRFSGTTIILLFQYLIALGRTQGQAPRMAALLAPLLLLDLTGSASAATLVVPPKQQVVVAHEPNSRHRANNLSPVLNRNATEIVILDADVADANALVARISERTAVYHLNANEDGIIQINRILAQHRHLKAVHLIGHGQDGSLQLGNSQLANTTLRQYRYLLTQWRQALAPNADILLYGCNFAQTAKGEKFVQQLSQLVGADVAASTDLTGDQAQGGNWTLEHQVGQIEPHAVSNLLAQATYAHLLITTTLNFNDTTPTLVSGTAGAQGATYRFDNVATGVDALVTLTQVSNAVLVNLDDNSNVSTRFEPIIRHNSGPNTTSFIRFSFQLVVSGTSTPVAATNVYYSAQDVDGNGTANAVAEFVEVIGARATYIASPTLLTSVAPSAGGVRYRQASASNVQSGIGTDDRYEIYSYLGNSVTSFSIIGGNINGSAACTIGVGCDRQNSWTFNVADVQRLDFGDAPSSYGDAFHPVPPTPSVYLGTSIDGDDGINYSANADADDTTGTDDENGVASFSTLTTTATSYSVTTSCAGTGRVAGWIDFNRNGTFDTGERNSNFTTSNCNSGSVTLNWTGLSGLSAGTTYARFRTGSTDTEVQNPTGLASNGEVEDYLVSITSVVNLSGTIFEDVNYGGGVGRSLAAASGVGRPNAQVELYNSSNGFVTFTTTGTNGAYTFTGIAAGTYTVRVVNSTVASSRGGTGLIGVQTFRTSGLTGTVGTADPSRVGGEVPTEVDAPANTTQTLTAINAVAGQEAQSVTPVTVGSSNISGIDFGFNFDTIVSTRDAGQGSLRQFILNSNALPNTGLAQAGLTAGVETSIFMISNGAANSGLRAGLTNQFSSGAATITLATVLPNITDANTAIDGRRQTALTGDTNAAVNESTTGPEIIIDATTGPGLQTTAANTLFDSLGITGANGAGTVGAGVYFNGAAVAGSIIRNSTVFSNDNAGITLQSSATNVQVLNNITRNNGVAEPNANGIEFVGVNNITVSGNQSLNNAGYGLDMLTSSSNNNTITNNLFKGNGFSAGTQDAGIGVRQGSNNIIILNTITGNQGDGIVIPLLIGGNTGNTITRNSIFANGELGIDLGSTTVVQGDGVTPNDIGDIDLGGNGLLNFPVIQNATISGSNLVLSGFARLGSIIELFVADPDASNFGEGKTYLVTLTEGATTGTVDSDNTTGSYTGLVNGLNQGSDNTNRFRFTIPLPTGITASTKLTATATLSSATSEFSGVVTVAGSPSLVLVKRITAINSTPITTVVDDPGDSNDTNPNWPSGALQGAIAGSVQPQQEAEYTIYFLSTGSSDAVNSRICDLVPANTVFVANAFSSGKGIRRTFGTTPTDFTNLNDADQGRFYTSTETAPTVCRVGSNVNGTVLTNVSGAVVVDLGTIPRAISSGNPANSYGFVRFRVKVN